MTFKQFKLQLNKHWISTRDTILTISGVAGIFFSFPIVDKFGWMAGAFLSVLGISALQAVWDGIAERARAKAMMETLNLMAQDGGFSAELHVTYKDERTTTRLKVEERS